ncbi:hypothetical protein [Frigidibacter sp.]|uniref:hypothetical protein n=1 Tax=Frigidibacter sp. TaxID=2586418 RepID=UPI0027362B02|nr:hypothetical protein [Frigidibacter sp.]MDP3340056.1 hypothetical protein [Frigidibacter sp.]
MTTPIKALSAAPAPPATASGSAAAQQHIFPAVGWVPAGPRKSASSRLQCYLQHEALCAAGESSVLLRRPRQYSRGLRLSELPGLLWRIHRSGARTIVFQKTGRRSAGLLMGLCKMMGRRVIYVECDEPRGLAFAPQVDLFIAPSRRLCDEITLQTGRPCLRIHDPVEHWDRDRAALPWQPRPVYRAVWVGNGKNWHQLVALRAMLQELGPRAPFEVTAISDHPEADIRWQEATVAADISRFDLGVIPVGGDRWSSFKSENRATLFMALGLPVVVQDSPLYAATVRHCDTGLVYADAEGLAALKPLLYDAPRMTALRHAALEEAEAFSLPANLALWRSAIAGA